MALIGCHVDDLACVGVRGELDDLKAFFRSHYSIKELGAATQLLGIKVDYNREAGTLKLSQTAMIDNLLNNFGYADCHPVTTPATEPRLFKYQPSEEETAQIKREFGANYSSSYRSIVGTLMWISVSTRPDISFAVI